MYIFLLCFAGWLVRLQAAKCICRLHTKINAYSATGFESKMHKFLVFLCVLICILLTAGHRRLQFGHKMLKDITGRKDKIDIGVFRGVIFWS